MSSQSKPTLFLLPGLLCDDVVWRAQVAALSPHVEVRVPSFRGFDSLKAMARSVLAQAPERFSVAGHSMGGRVALELAHMAGKRIDKLAVLDSGAHPVKPGEPEKRQVLLDLADSQGLEAVADAWAPPMLHPERRGDTALMAEIRAMILRYSVDEFKGQIRALLERDDHSAYLPGISQHVLLVVGDQDEWSPVAQHREMQHELASAELRVVENAGHMVTMERPEAVNRILVEWMKS